MQNLGTVYRNARCTSISSICIFSKYKFEKKTVSHRAIDQRWVCESLSRVQISAATWTVAPQAPLFLGFSRQEFWSASSCPSPSYLQYQDSIFILLQTTFPTKDMLALLQVDPSIVQHPTLSSLLGKEAVLFS